MKSRTSYTQQILAGLVAVLAFGTAHAAEATGGGSEFFYQAASGTSDVTGHLGYRSFTSRDKTAGATDVTISGLDMLGVGYEYGINEMLAVGADLSYSAMKIKDSDVKVNGIEDLQLSIKGMSPMGGMRLRYGALLGIPLQKAEIKSDNASPGAFNGQLTRSTGGVALTPYVGADMDAGPGILGARLSYELKFKHQEKNPLFTGDVDVENGNALGLAAFYEYMMSDMLFGADLHYTSMMKTKLAGAEVANSDANVLGLDLYTRIPLMANASIIPMLAYDFSGGSHYDKYSDLNISVAARFGF
jgi:hypothetical protein